MKKQLIVVSLVSALLLLGCSSKGSSSGLPAGNRTNSVTATSDTQQAPQGAAAEAVNIDKQRIEVNTDFKPLQPNTVQKLTPQQKAQLDSKLNSTLKSIDNTLKSLQDAPEINLNSVGN